jgi:hypothetical protein
MNFTSSVCIKWEMFKRFSGKPVYTEDHGLFLNQSFNLYPCATIHLSLWQFKNPLTSIPSSLRSLPPFEQYPRKEKGRCGLPAAREVRRRVGLASGGPCGHDEVWLDDGDGRNRPVHARRRASSSAACAPAYPRRYMLIQGHGELHRVLMSRPMQGIKE